jgi:hypothetical protein
MTLAPVPVRSGQPLCLYLEWPEKASQWHLFNVAGDLVAEARFSAGQRCLDTQKLSPGIYIARIRVAKASGGGESLVQKIAVLP